MPTVTHKRLHNMQCFFMPNIRRNSAPFPPQNSIYFSPTSYKKFPHCRSLLQTVSFVPLMCNSVVNDTAFKITTSSVPSSFYVMWTFVVTVGIVAFNDHDQKMSQNTKSYRKKKSTSDGCKKTDTLFKHVILRSTPDTSGKLLPSPEQE
jgi:beta-lactamase regulating signal transducer with metallopeptidase domain